MPLLKRHIDHYGHPPRDVAADGAYATVDNLTKAKGLGVSHIAFHKRAGLTVEAMTGDRWLYNKLRNFRAGIEATISYLKRCFGLSRCNWKGFDHFKAYVHSAVFTHNLVVLTQRLAASASTSAQELCTSWSSASSSSCAHHDSSQRQLPVPEIIVTCH